MSTALAIFVKTPEYSPVKTRLAAAIGEDNATAFYRLAAAAVAQVAAHAQEPERALRAHWAVAEAAAMDDPAWHALPRVEQGEGDLGSRLHHVYSTLRASNGRVLLLGADAPQLTIALLWAAIDALDDAATAFVLGEASDGGFWLFGGRMPIPESIWRGVRYSRSSTADELRTALKPLGGIASLPALTDVDSASDFGALADALDALSDPLPAQRALRAWLQALPATSSARAVHA